MGLSLELTVVATSGLPNWQLLSTQSLAVRVTAPRVGRSDSRCRSDGARATTTVTSTAGRSAERRVDRSATSFNAAAAAAAAAATAANVVVTQGAAAAGRANRAQQPGAQLAAAEVS
jgi:hypothetical protein